MKKIDGVYSKIISKENLYRSAYMASRGRRYRDTTADFNFRLEEEIESLHRELSAKTYRHGAYRLFTIYDPKERLIAAAPFRDRVVHHAVHDVIEPVIDRSFIYDSYACRKNKGTHKAVDRAQEFLRQNRYCLHGDIKKYFYSIDCGVLKKMIARRIEDRDLLWLLGRIVGEAKGLPIGNLTSQFFANLYLNELDYFVKFEIRQRYYIRYMDDFLVFGNDKNALRDIRGAIGDFLMNGLALSLHDGKTQIYKTGKGIKFLGFRLYRNYRRLASDNVRRFRRRLKRFSGQWLVATGERRRKIRESVRCWVAHAKYADTTRLRLVIYSGLRKKNGSFAGLLGPVLLGDRLLC